jgi:NAD(P)H-dependent FMN reductase
VAVYLEKKLKKMGVMVNFIDLLEYKHPFLDKMYKAYPKGKAPEPMEKLSNLFAESDGSLIVTGEYNHSIPPVL